VLALVATFAWTRLRPAPAVQAAQELARTVRLARWRAVAAGHPVVLLAEGGAVVAVGASGWTCSPAPPRQTVWEAGSARIALAWPLRGVAFGADGFPRSCRGDGVGSATITVDSLHDAAAVVVSALGRVRWERRP
jgi:Tfp pilus assembly protein FimT